MGAEQSHLEDLNSSSDFAENLITFFVNGKEYNVKTTGCDPEINPQYLLVDYLRDKIGLTGTKYMCREGGCGSCSVAIKSINPATGQQNLVSANACLLPLFSCDGLEITTVEALGNRKDGYSQLQQRLVQFAGTQCGFCSPGFVMNMHTTIQSNPRFASEDAEGLLDGNICRCTGFRPILDTFKSMSANPGDELQRKCADIEDAYKCHAKQGECHERSFEIIHPVRGLHLHSSNGEQWFKVTDLPSLFAAINKFTSSQMKYRLVAGNTGTGVFKNDGPYDGYIDINNVPELQYTSLDKYELVLGGTVTLSGAMTMFKRAGNIEGFEYADEFYNHLQRVACLQVRNRGTLAGNLMLKHSHKEFSSDLFLLLESIGATLRIGSTPALFEECTMLDFLNLDMTGKVILSIHFPAYAHNFIFKSFKIGKRHHNASAYVNAAFLFEVDPSSKTILSLPRICFGGINPTTVHALSTEKYLKGKQLTNSTLQTAMNILEQDIKPDSMPQDASAAYRLGLTQSLLYKFLLQIIANEANPRLRSGAYEIDRGNHIGKQTFDSDRTQWPLRQPIPKIESFQQVSGEAQYINDIRPQPGELFGAFVLSTVGNATISSINAAEALSTPGVVAFITAKDIPGVNTYLAYSPTPEQIFADGAVIYTGQSIGLIVATNKYIAFEARSKVVVNYSNIKVPIVDILDAVKTKENSNNKEIHTNLAYPCRGSDSRKSQKVAADIISQLKHTSSSKITVKENLHKVKGEFRTSGQYHLTMETQICICVPKEDGMDVYSSTQAMDFTQNTISSCLAVPMNSVTVHVRRIGGGFGCKSTRAGLTAAACAIAAHTLNRPVRVALDLETNMQMMGKRFPYLVKYNVDVDDLGKIHKLESNIDCDAGCVPAEGNSLFGMICSQSCYQANNWNVVPGVVTTNTASNTFCRSPGSAQGVSIIESIMEHIAHTVNKDPWEVREINFIHKGDPFIGVPGATLPLDNLIPKIYKELSFSGEIESRKKLVESFNMNNRWKKRGLSIVPQRAPCYYWDFRYPTLISVYHLDGTVTVSHGGVDMGQGVNTKVLQVVAHTLQIPVEKVRVAPSNSVVSPNTSISGGSITSELVCSSARLACKQLLARLAPLRKALGNPTWEQLIAAANRQEILLTSQAQQRQGDVKAYDVYGIAATEVEVDILTGDFKIVRADTIVDAGESINPLIDVGQIEGAFIMGLSWWVNEQLIYDKETGALLTDNTWTYKPMLASDIPEDFRVTILKNAPNPFGVLSSKATGEPPLNTAVSVIFALRNAIDSARKEVGNTAWFRMDGPVIRETIRELSLTSPEQFTF